MTSVRMSDTMLILMYKLSQSKSVLYKSHSISGAVIRITHKRHNISGAVGEKRAGKDPIIKEGEEP